MRGEERREEKRREEEMREEKRRGEKRREEKRRGEKRREEKRREEERRGEERRGEERREEGEERRGEEREERRGEERREEERKRRGEKRRGEERSGSEEPERREEKRRVYWCRSRIRTPDFRIGGMVSCHLYTLPLRCKYSTFLSDHSVRSSKNSSSSPLPLMMSLRTPFTQQSFTNMFTREVPSNTAEAIPGSVSPASRPDTPQLSLWSQNSPRRRRKMDETELSRTLRGWILTGPLNGL
ncbi:hypothetical protein SRHO_G00276060 [Serrasalmus rhombeus]